MLLTIDLEELDRLASAGLVDESMELPTRGTQALMELLDRLEVPATWFTTATFARARPSLVRELALGSRSAPGHGEGPIPDAGMARGDGHGTGSDHEVALHALDHTDDYKAMDPERAGKRLGLAKKLLEGITGKPMVGFRAPRYQHPPRQVLADLGLRYDSSHHPTPIPGRYSGRGPTGLFRDPDCDLPVMPVSVVPGLRLPLSWLWFRGLPEGYLRWGASLVEARCEYLCLYLHPWDMVDLTPHKRWLLPGYTVGTAGALERLERFLKWGMDRGWWPMTMQAYLRQKEWL